MRRLLNKIHRRRPKIGITFSGPYKSRAEAAALSSGYDAKAITDGVLAAMAQVKQGRAAMERDGFTLDKPQYPYPLLAALLHAAAVSRDKTFNVLDFGGSLGSSYFACKAWLDGVVQNVCWTVVEQPHFVEIGSAQLATNSLRFTHNLEQLVDVPNLVLISGVLMYLEEPYLQLQRLLGLGAATVLIDRTATVDRDQDLITVEHVCSPTYQASYPCCFLSLNKLRSTCVRDYDCMEVFPAIDKFQLSFANVNFVGMLLKRREQC
jgi:putative methyltransferase (TIGR04325 family)